MPSIDPQTLAAEDVEPKDDPNLGRIDEVENVVGAFFWRMVTPPPGAWGHVCVLCASLVLCGRVVAGRGVS